MVFYYELVDLDTANVVGFYESKEAALAIVRRSFELYGLRGIEDLALSEESPGGEGRLLAEGADLLRLALAAPLPQGAG
jgi:hypothetical protein